MEENGGAGGDSEGGQSSGSTTGEKSASRHTPEGRASPAPPPGQSKFLSLGGIPSATRSLTTVVILGKENIEQ